VEVSGYRISCNQTTEVVLPVAGIKKAWLEQESGRKELKFMLVKDGIHLTIQPIKNGLIVLE
jgi:hypothetical protein